MKKIIGILAALSLSSCTLLLPEQSSPAAPQPAAFNQGLSAQAVPLPSFDDLSQGGYVSGSLFYSATNPGLSGLAAGMVIRFRVDRANANDIEGEYEYIRYGSLRINEISTVGVLADLLVYESNGNVIRDSQNVFLSNGVTNSLDGIAPNQVLFVSAPSNWRTGFDGGSFLKFLSILDDNTRTLFSLRTSDYPNGYHPSGLVSVNMDGSAVYDLRGILPVGGVGSNGIVLSEYSGSDIRSNDRILDYEEGGTWTVIGVDRSVSGYVSLSFSPAENGGAFDFTWFSMNGNLKELGRKFQVSRTEGGRKQSSKTLNLFSSTFSKDWVISSSGNDILKVEVDNTFDLDFVVKGSYDSGFHKEWRVWKCYPWFKGGITAYLEMNDEFRVYSTLKIRKSWDQSVQVCDPKIIIDAGIPFIISIPVRIGVEGSCSMYGAASTGVKMLGKFGGSLSFKYKKWKFSADANPISEMQFSLIPLEADISGSAMVRPYISVVPQISACGIIGMGMPLKLYGEINLSGEAHYHPTNKSGSLSLSLDCGLIADASLVIGTKICGIKIGHSFNLGRILNWKDRIYSWSWPREAGLGEPQQVTGLTAVSLNNGAIQLNWRRATGATGYWVYRRANAADITERFYVTGTNYLDKQPNGLAMNFYYIVSANTTTIGPASALVSNSTKAPTAPTGLTLSANADGTISLNWNNSDSAVSYLVYQVTGGITNIRNAGKSNSFSDAEVRIGNYYDYSVSAVNYQCEGPCSAKVSGYPALPGTVSDLGITGMKSTGISLAWTALPGAISYYLYISPKSDTPLSNCRVLYTTDTAITDTVVQPDSTNFYRITVSNRIAEGLPGSNELYVFVPLPACALTTWYLPESNWIITGTASFNNSESGNSVWVSFNNSGYGKADIYLLSNTFYQWSFSAPFSYNQEIPVSCYAMDAYGIRSTICSVVYSNSVSSTNGNSSAAESSAGASSSEFALSSAAASSSELVLSSTAASSSDAASSSAAVPSSTPASSSVAIPSSTAVSSSAAASSSGGNGIYRIVIGGYTPPAGGGGTNFLAWYRMSTNNAVNFSQTLVGPAVAKNLWNVNSGNTADYSGGTPITAGTYFVLSDSPTGNTGGSSFDRYFSFYNSVGNLICQKNITNVNATNLLYNNNNQKFAIFYYDGVTVTMWTNMQGIPRYIDQIKVYGNTSGSIQGGGYNYLGWYNLSATKVLGTQPLVGGVYTNGIGNISDSHPATFSDSTNKIWAGTNFVAWDTHPTAASGWAGILPVFKFIDQYGTTISILTNTNRLSGNLQWDNGDKTNAHYTLFHFNGTNVTTTQY